MRAGLSAIQQTLTPEASIIINQSMAEAARRRHGQTTPLHVASTLLASPSGLFRHACARSQPVSSHPLQCRALELCFSVALDRLPSSSSSYSSLWQPSISNALMAALKRAQAHQRRGCNEHQQLIAMKVELEQLIVSILDDPSVSRVMREASFSSPAVKTVIQQCLLARPVFSLIHGEVHTSLLSENDESPVKTDLVLGPPAKDQQQKYGFFKRIFSGLSEKVIWQREAAAIVAAAVVRCKYGGGRRRTDSWLLFLGEDRMGKNKMAEVLAELVFSAAPVIVSAEDGGAIDRLAQALRRNQSSVIVLEDVNLMEIPAQKKLKQAMERGCFMDFYRREVQFGDAIFVLLSQSSQEEKISMDERASAKKQCLDLNLAATSDEEPSENSRQRGARFVSELVDVVDEVVVFKLASDVSGDRRRARRRNGGGAD